MGNKTSNGTNVKLPVSHLEIKEHNPITCLVFGFIRNYVQNDKGFVAMIPSPIKYIICDFYGYFLCDSKILTGKQAHDLYELLSQRLSLNNLINASLLLRGSRDGFNTHSFVPLLKGKSPYLYIIHTNFGNICGGYSTFDVECGTSNRKDSDAFLYVLKSDIKYQKPEIFGLKDDHIQHAIYNYYGSSAGWSYMFHFGSAAGLAIYNNCNKNTIKSFCFGGHSYELSRGNIMCGGNDTNSDNQYFFYVIDIEVYHIPND